MSGRAIFFDSTMVGDRRHDIVGAVSNGMRPVAVLYGYGSREELEIAGAGSLYRRLGFRDAGGWRTLAGAR